MNGYQKRKAKLIAAVILSAACQSENVFMCDLPVLAAKMGESEWRTVSFAAAVPVASGDTRAAVVAILGGLA